MICSFDSQHNAYHTKQDQKPTYDELHDQALDEFKRCALPDCVVWDVAREINSVDFYNEILKIDRQHFIDQVIDANVYFDDFIEDCLHNHDEIRELYKDQIIEAMIENYESEL